MAAGGGGRRRVLQGRDESRRGWKARGRAAPGASPEDRRREDGWSEDLFRRREERYGGSWVGHDLFASWGTGRWGKTDGQQKNRMKRKTDASRVRSGPTGWLGYAVPYSIPRVPNRPTVFFGCDTYILFRQKKEYIFVIESALFFLPSTNP